MFKKNLLVYLVYRKTHDIELQGKIVPISLRYINRKTRYKIFKSQMSVSTTPHDLKIEVSQQKEKIK